MKKLPHCSLRFLLLAILQFHLFTSAVYTKSVIESCRTSDTCNALLSYVLPWDSKLSEIAYRFHINISSLLASNSIDPTESWSGNRILRANSTIRVPISCSCISGIRQYPLVYAVDAADSLESISQGFGGLLSPEQIRSINDKIVVTNGRKIMILIPCTCFNNSHNGLPAVFMSYVVKTGEHLSSIGGKFEATVNELQRVNGFGQGNVDPGDILAIPVPACSSSNLDWHNESMILPSGSYGLTANDCIKCSCGGPNDLRLQCSASGLVGSCAHLRCKGSNLFVGQVYETHTNFGCNVVKCVYRGHLGHKIHRSLVNSSHIQCLLPGNGSEIAISTDPKWENPLVPSLEFSPSPSPSDSLQAASMTKGGTADPNATYFSGGGRITAAAAVGLMDSPPAGSCFTLLLLFLLALSYSGIISII